LDFNTTIELKIITIASDNTDTLLVETYPTRSYYFRILLLGFLISIVVLIPCGQFLDYATIAVRVRYKHVLWTVNFIVLVLR